MDDGVGPAINAARVRCRVGEAKRPCHAWEAEILAPYAEPHGGFHRLRVGRGDLVRRSDVAHAVFRVTDVV